MKRLFSLLLFCALSPSLFAQGISFAEGDWKSVLAQAAAQKKLVYVDVYTTWCGPCKQLAATVFPKKAAGDKYNALFVNYRFDAEKGEGVALAEKYGVEGYPTHLFINPVNGAVVYRGMGYSGRMDDFLHEADVAMLEYRDPVSWDKYTSQFKSGKRDRKFLKAYLEKAKRLGKNNDEIINAYFATMKPKYSPEDIAVLEQNLMTLDNKAYPVLAERWNTLYPESRDARYRQAAELLEPTLRKAVETRNEKLLDAVVAAAKKYSDHGEELQYYYPTEFFSRTDNIERTKAAMIEEANFYLNKSAAEYVSDDQDASKERIAALRQQTGVAENPDEAAMNVQRTIVDDPAVMHPVSAAAADRLNSLAWMTYERYGEESPMVTQALEWSHRSMNILGDGADPKQNPDWPSYADTYAHLLYVSGDKDGAIRMESEALKVAGNKEGAESLALELEKMREGKL